MSTLRTLVLGLVVVFGAVGCVESGIELDWVITLDGADATCTDVNAADVRVTSINDSTSEQFSDRFACGAYHGTTQALTGGTYTVTVDLLDPYSVPLADSVVLTNVQVDDGGLTKLPLIAFDFTSAPATAQFGYAWTIQLASGMPTTCAAGEYVSVVATGTGQPIDDTFDCTTMAGDSSLLELGSYTLLASLVNDNGTPIDMTDDIVLDQITQMASLTAGGVIVDVPTFAFVVP